jgi:HK97 family phage portal protein
MRIFGLEITRRKTLQAVGEDRGMWHPLVREPFGGAWQRNIEIRKDSVLSYHADFACRTLIAGDVAKLRVKLVQKDASGIWSETTNPAYTPFLRKPNDFQNRIQFFESWMLSKLQSGNAYILKQRDGRGVVTKGYVLDPNRVTVLVADDGSVFYRLAMDKIASVENDVIVPAREIIHDRFNCMFHPLIGVSPIFANGLAATQGLSIQTESALLFKNNSMPGGLLVAPTAIEKADADKIKQQWESTFGGANRGRVGVIGNNVKFEKIPFSAVEGQLIEQLRWTAEVVCSTYHVPPYKIGIGELPKGFTNIQALNIEYYNTALQRHIEDIEVCLDEGLGTGDALGTEFDTDNLLRMDSVTQMDVLDKAKNILTPDEQRAALNKGTTPGGAVVYRQQQDFSLEALAKRDAQDNPFGTSAPAAPTPAEAQAANDNATAAAAKEAMIEIVKGFR